MFCAIYSMSPIQCFDFSAGTDTFVYVWITDWDSSRGGGLLNLLNGTLMFYEQGRSSNVAKFWGKIQNALITSPPFLCILKENPAVKIDEDREVGEALPFTY